MTAQQIGSFIYIGVGFILTIISIIIGIKKTINIPIKAYFNDKFQDHKEYIAAILNQLLSTTNENCHKIDNMEEMLTRHDTIIKDHFEVVYKTIEKTVNIHDKKLSLIEKKMQQHDGSIKEMWNNVNNIKKIVDKNKNGND